jgi:hypothetical protein
VIGAGFSRGAGLPLGNELFCEVRKWRCLGHIGKPYRLFPQRFKSVGLMMNHVDSSKEEVIILKMHGSIDWFDRSEYEKSEKFIKSKVTT